MIHSVLLDRPLVVTGIGTTAVTTGSLRPGTSYQRRVRSRNASGVSGWSAEINTKTSA